LASEATKIARPDNPMAGDDDREAISAHHLAHGASGVRSIDAVGELSVGDGRPRWNQTCGIPDRSLKAGAGWRLDVIEIHQLTTHGVQKSAAEFGEEARIGFAEQFDGSTASARAGEHVKPTGFHQTGIGAHDVERSGRRVEDSMAGVAAQITRRISGRVHGQHDQED
jgi:hypothetical protein